MAGIFIQSVAFGGIGTAVGLAEDLQKGLIERFRALPMARSAVLAGRTTADLVRNMFVLLLMTGVGCAVGFNFPNGALAFVAGCALVLFFAYALLWGFAVIGLVGIQQRDGPGHGVPDPVPADLRLAGVRARHLHARLAAVVRHQSAHRHRDHRPRSLMLGAQHVPGSVSEHVLVALAWCVGVLVVLAPLAVWRYRRST